MVSIKGQIFTTIETQFFKYFLVVVDFFKKNVPFEYQIRYLTSRDRPKSAPYLRLKNSKRTSICQSIGELGTLL